MDEEFLKLNVESDIKSDNKQEQKVAGDKKALSDSEGASVKNNDSSIYANEEEYIKRVSSNILTELNKAVHNLQQESKQATQNLKDMIESLQKESYVLQKLPNHFKENLNLVIPEISKEIKIQCLKDLDEGIRGCYDNVGLLEDTAITMIGNLNTLDVARMKRTIIQMALTIAIAVSCSAFSTYLMMQKFPSFVSLEASGNIQIENSNIHVASQKEPMVRTTVKKTSLPK